MRHLRCTVIGRLQGFVGLANDVGDVFVRIVDDSHDPISCKTRGFCGSFDHNAAVSSATLTALFFHLNMRRGQLSDGIDVAASTANNSGNSGGRHGDLL